MTFEELTRGFAAKLGLRELAIEDDTVALEIDGIPFGFINDDVAGTLTIVAGYGQAETVAREQAAKEPQVSPLAGGDSFMRV